MRKFSRSSAPHKFRVGASSATAFLLAVTCAALAFNKGDLLENSVHDNFLGVGDDALSYVVVVDIVRDPTTEPDSPRWGKWEESGTMRVNTIESSKADFPTDLKVRYRKLPQDLPIAWTWYGVHPKEGDHLLGFFQKQEKDWGVREDNYSEIISDINDIDPRLLAKVRAKFHLALLPSASTRPGSRPTTRGM